MCLEAFGGESGECGTWSVLEGPGGWCLREIELEESVAGGDCCCACVQGEVDRRNGGGRSEGAAVDWRSGGD